MTLVLEVLTVAPFGENTYLVGDAERGVAAVVDPGGRGTDVVRAAEHRGLRIEHLVGTHAHIDHVSGVRELQDLTGAPYRLHREAEAMLAALPDQAALFGLPRVEPPTVDDYLEHGDTVAVGGIGLQVRYAPGHAPGHVILVGPEAEISGRRRPFALVGDVIFLGSIGRTDLAGGDYDTLMASIEREVLSLPDETVLYSGHGPATTVGAERLRNPFVLDWLSRGPDRT